MHQLHRFDERTPLRAAVLTATATALAIAVPLQAGVIRHDRPDSAYQELAEEFPSVGSFQFPTGRGTFCSWTLISPDWALTAAHCLTDPAPANPGVIDLSLAGQTEQGSETIVHRNWDGALAKGWDIALIRLNNPMEHVEPAKLYRDSGERRRIAIGVGFGNTGNGNTGQQDGTAGTKRAGMNVIDTVDLRPRSNGRVLGYDFDEPGNDGALDGVKSGVLDLEYGAGEGDSGGGLFIADIVGDQFLNSRLAGVASSTWETRFAGGQPEFEYHENFGYTRVSRFIDWIEGNTITPDGERRGWTGDNSGNGRFGVAEHWNGGGTPDADTSAIFRSSGPATPHVHFEQNQSSERVIVRQGVGAEIDLRGKTWTLDTDQGYMNAIVLGQREHIAGRGDRATLTLIDGEVTASRGVTVAYNTGSRAAMILDGAEVSTNQLLDVGYGGEGFVSVFNGSRIEAFGMRIGNNPGSAGRMLVSGDTTTLNSLDNVLIGQRGQGTLELQDGATADVSGGIGLGLNEDSSGDLVLSGASTTANVATEVKAARVEDSEAGIALRDQAVLDVTENVVIGEAGRGRLIIEEDAALQAGLDVIIGQSGEAEAQIESGGRLQASNRLQLGQNSDASGANLTVTGANSEATANQFGVGVQSAGNATIESGGKLVGQSGGFIGLQSAGEINVSGRDGEGNASLLDVRSGDFVIGRNSDGVLTVESRGHVRSDGTTILGAGSDGVGTVNLSGAGTQWEDLGSEMRVGGDGTGQITVAPRATLQTGAVALGYGNSSSGTVAIEGGTWQTRTYSSLRVGRGGEGDLDIRGAAGETGRLELAPNANLNIGNITFGGQGFVDVQVGGEIILGHDAQIQVEGYDYTNRLQIDGGVVREQDGASGEVRVGETGRGVVSILNGGQLSVSELEVATPFGTASVEQAGAFATARHVGSRLEADEIVRVADGSNGTLNMLDGAEGRFIGVREFRIGIETPGAEQAGRFAAIGGGIRPGTEQFVPSRAEVSPAVGTDVVIGEAGRGTMSAEDGGRITVVDASVVAGEQAGSEAIVTVDGGTLHGDLFVPSRLRIDRDLELGRDGRAIADVRHGGSLRVGREIRIGDNSDGGGELNVDGGEVVTGSIIVEQGAASPFNNLFEDGLIHVRHGQIRDTSPVMRIDGTEAGDLPTLRLTGADIDEPSQLMVIGGTHAGRLELTDDAAMRNETVVLGDLADADGRATVTDLADWRPTSGMTVGRFGDGVVEIRGGSEVQTSGDVVVAEHEGSNGRIELSGRQEVFSGVETSRFTLEGDGDDLAIGQAGTGELLVHDGAEATVGGNLDLADTATGAARVVVSGEYQASEFDPGTPSLLHVHGHADISHAFTDTGFGGQLPAATGSASVTVSDGGILRVDGQTDIGTSLSEAVTVQIHDGVLRTGGLAVHDPGMIDLQGGQLRVDGQGRQMTGFAGRDFVLGDGPGDAVPEELMLRGVSFELDRAAFDTAGDVVASGDKLTVGHAQMAAMRLSQGAVVRVGSAAIGDQHTGSRGAGGEVAGIGPSAGYQGAVFVNEKDTFWQVDLGLQIGSPSGEEWDGNGLLAVTDGARVDVGGDIHVETASDVRLDGGTISGRQMNLQAGTLLEGIGRIESDIRTAGVISPGTSPGVLEIVGDLVMEQELGLSELIIEVLGDQPGEFDVLDVTGQAWLGGTLTLDWAPSFVPEVGMTLPFLRAGEIIGEFDALNLSRPIGGPAFTFDYSPTGVSLSVVPEPATALLIALGGALLAGRPSRGASRRDRCRDTLR